MRRISGATCSFRQIIRAIGNRPRTPYLPSAPARGRSGNGEYGSGRGRLGHLRKPGLQRISVTDGFRPPEHGNPVFDARSVKVAVCVVGVFAYFGFQIEAGKLPGGKNFRPVFDRPDAVGQFIPREVQRAAAVGKVHQDFPAARFGERTGYLDSVRSARLEGVVVRKVFIGQHAARDLRRREVNRTGLRRIAARRRPGQAIFKRERTVEVPVLDV